MTPQSALSTLLREKLTLKTSAGLSNHSAYQVLTAQQNRRCECGPATSGRPLHAVRVRASGSQCPLGRFAVTKIHTSTYKSYILPQFGKT